tara:strand:+ start:424 stop:636 length:213 start_codon:yes stop_codon:yes gene_type:complete
VKNSDQNNQLFNKEISSNNKTEIDKIKTTNVNILLNRVKLDKRRTLKKRITFTLSLVVLISALAIYFNLQ